MSDLLDLPELPGFPVEARVAILERAAARIDHAPKFWSRVSQDLARSEPLQPWTLDLTVSAWSLADLEAALYEAALTGKVYIALIRPESPLPFKMVGATFFLVAAGLGRAGFERWATENPR